MSKLRALFLCPATGPALTAMAPYLHYLLPPVLRPVGNCAPRPSPAPSLPPFPRRWAEIRQELLQTPHGRERLLAGRPKIEGVPWIEEQIAAIKQVPGMEGCKREGLPCTVAGKPAPASCPCKPHPPGLVAIGCLDLLHLLQHGAQRRSGKPHRRRDGEQAVAVNAVAGAPAEGRPAAGQPEPGGRPAESSTEEAVPPSAFAAAAAATPSAAQQAAPDEGPAVEEAAAPAAGGGRSRAERQGTGLTVFYTASEELPPPPQQAQEHVPLAGAGSSGSAGPAAAGRRRVQVARVGADGHPLPAVAEDAPAVEGGSPAGSRPPSSAAYSADRSSSEDAEV